MLAALQTTTAPCLFFPGTPDREDELYPKRPRRGTALECGEHRRFGLPFVGRGSHEGRRPIKRQGKHRQFLGGTDTVSASEPRVHVIGVGADGTGGLTARARDLLLSADLVLGAEEALALVPEVRAEKLRLGPDLQEVVRTLDANRGRRTVIVAGGDPLFYGVAPSRCDRLGKDRFEVLPHVSSMQLAFARVKESWEDAYLTNLATHPLADVLDRVRTADTVGLFTSETE